MTKVLGALLLLGGCVGIAQKQVQSLFRRADVLRSFLNALEIMERELEFRLPSMEQVFAAGEQNSEKPVSSFFHVCSEELARGYDKPLSEIWCRAAKEQLSELKQNELKCIFALGSVLGRYDAEGQRKMIQETRESLAKELSCAISERQSKGKLYTVLGAATGALLVILLL